MKLEHIILTYLEEILGKTPESILLERERIHGLPYFLANSYQFFGCDLFGCRLVFAQPKNNKVEATPAEYARQVVQLQDHFKEPVALLLPRIEAYQRNRLVQMGVPFIVPNRQLFLPQLMIDLREHFPRAVSRQAKQLSPPAQLVFLYHLLAENVGEFSLRELARRTGYSATTLTKVQEELKSFGLCEIRRKGRSKFLHFGFSGKKLWKAALPILRSPVRGIKPVRDIAPRLLVMKAGLSALAEKTHLNADRVPTYAVKESTFKKAVHSGEVVAAQDRDEATAIVELWAYDPKIVSNQDVDVLSLFLSLKNDPNERVQGALKKLLDGHLESGSW